MVDDAAIAKLADLAWGPMDAEEAASFLSLKPERFANLAPSLPRHKPSGMSYRYLRSELLAWSRGETGSHAEVATPAWGVVEGRGKKPNPGGRKSAKRLV